MYSLCSRAAALIVVLYAPRAADAAATGVTTIPDIITGFGNAVEPLVAVGLGAAVLVFVWGLVLFIRNSGDDKAVAEGRKRMVWGIVALFLIVSIWSIVAILNTIVGVSGVNVCPPPQIGDGGVSTCF